MVLIFAISNINAKTIWIVDLTNNHQNMVKMVNGIIDDLKLSSYKNYLKYIDNYNKLSRTPGDIIIEFNGLSLETNTGNISYFFVIFCKVQENYCMDYKANDHSIFSPEYLFERARIMRNNIITNLDKYF